MTTSNWKDGEANLVACVLLKNDSTGKQQSIKAQAVNISVYEDVGRPFTVCEIVMEDGIDLLTSFPISGEESIFIHWAGQNGAEIKQYFTVEAILNVSVNNEHTMQRYTLKGISPFAMQNATATLTKSWKLTHGEQIVTSILQQNMGYSGPIDSTPTVGPMTIVSPGWRPFSAINYVKWRSISQSDQSSLYLAYYDRTGTFRFRTVETLIANPVGSKQYVRYRSAETDHEISRQNMILKWQVPQRENTYRKIAEGAFGVTVNAFDFFTKRLVSQSSGADSRFITPNKYAHQSGNMFSPDMRANMAFRGLANQTKSVYIPVNLAPDVPSTFQVEVYNRKMQYAASMEGLAIAEVYGDATIGVGSLVFMTIPRADTKFDSVARGSIDRMPYLVMRAKHTLIRNQDKFEYRQTLECLLTGYAR